MEMEADIAKIREEYETEVFDKEGVPEDELHQGRKKYCTKYPGHTKFYPIKDFMVDHLPLKWREPKVWRAVRRLASNTVHLSVSFTSQARPDKYCASGIRGTDRVRTGTGLAYIYPDHVGKPSQPCPLEGCQLVQGPHDVTTEFRIVTATHVVFNTEEARKTKVTFFLDEEGQPSSTAIVAQGLECCSETGTWGESATFSCVSHDLSLFEKVTDYPELEVPPPVPPQEKRDPLVVVISHPHGCTKQVTSGKWTNIRTADMTDMFRILRDPQMIDNMPLQKKMMENVVSEASVFDPQSEAGESFSRILYTTPTCPGSSGAPVYLFYDGDDGKMSFSLVTSHFGVKFKSNASGCALTLDPQPLKRFAQQLRKEDQERKKKAEKKIDDNLPLD